MVGKFWEDKWEYEIFTYIVGDPLLKMELMACADLVGGTTEQRYFFPDLI